MYLCIIKIKINIYIFYTSYRTAMNGQSIPLSFNRTEIWVLWILPPVLELWLICARKKKNPTRSHSTLLFSFLQVALSLEDHSSEVQVVKHLLHSLSRPFPPATSPPHLQARCAPLHKKHPEHTCTRIHRTRLGVWRACQVQKMVQVKPDAIFSMGNPTAVEVTGFCAFPSVLPMWVDEKKAQKWTGKWNDILNYETSKR